MTLKDYHFIFVHGYTSSSQGDWYPQMAAKLDALGASYAMPDLPGGDRPEASEWLPIIHQEVKKADNPVVLVGQSLGTRAVMLYLHDYPSTIVAAVFLVATFNNDLKANKYKRGEGYANFWEYPIDPDQLKIQADKWVILHAYDDQNIPYTQAKDMAGLLDAKLVLSRGQAHFNDPSHADYILQQFKNYLLPRQSLVQRLKAMAARVGHRRRR